MAIVVFLGTISNSGPLPMVATTQANHGIGAVVGDPCDLESAWVVGMTDGQFPIIPPAFTPNELSIGVGDVVRWASSDNFHTTTSDDELWDSGPVFAGEHFDVQFCEASGAEGYAYHCDAHPMDGVIFVA